MLRAVLFDMDDTLIDWSKREDDWMASSRECWRPIYEHLSSSGRTMPELDVITQTFADNIRAAWERVAPPDWICPRQIDVLHETLTAVNLQMQRSEVEKLQRLYGWKGAPGVCLFDDTLEVLKALRAAGLRIGLVTNADMPMWMRDVELQKFAILEHIEVRLTAGDVGHLKPHPAPFREAMKRLSVLPDEAVFVGDRLQDDVIGARTAGMRAVWIRRQHSTWVEPQSGSAGLKPNATIQHLRELLTTFDLWYPGWRTAHEAENIEVSTTNA